MYLLKSMSENQFPAKQLLAADTGACALMSAVAAATIVNIVNRAHICFRSAVAPAVKPRRAANV